MNKEKTAIIAGVVLGAVLGALIFNSGGSISRGDLTCEGCNVLVIGFDALQANHVSHLGYERETTPTLDTLASRGVSFANHYAVASWTVPSFMSYFTSLYPSEHGVVNKFSAYTPTEKKISNLAEISPEVQTLAQAFKEAGYKTGGFTGDAGVNSVFGYAQGFDVYTDEVAFGSVGNSSQHALKWLDENEGEPFFMFLHGYDAHGQFSGIDETYESRFGEKGEFEITPSRQRDLREQGLAEGDLTMSEGEVQAWNDWYDSKILDADERIGSFLEEMEKRGLLGSTVVVVISDHGTEVYDHKRLDHGYSLYNELIRVPLVVAVPGQEKSRLIKTQVRSIDLAPTLFAITGIDINEVWESQVQGKSLISVITGEDKTNRPVFSETDYRNFTHKRSYIDEDGWKLIYTLETGGSELYNIRKDPMEREDVASKNGRRVEQMKEILFEHMQGLGVDPEGEWPIGCLPVYGDQCQ